MAHTMHNVIRAVWRRTLNERPAPAGQNPTRPSDTRKPDNDPNDPTTTLTIMAE